MKYLIGIVFLFISLGLLLVLAKCIYLGFNDNWTWFLVALPIFATNLVSVLITTVGFEEAFKA
jgi:hypothetical protein